MCPAVSYELTRPMPVFDIESYVGRSRAVDIAAIAWADVPRYPVSPEMIRTLRYMQDVESHTIIYLRSLLATRAVDDPDVATFLACWVYEETFHGLALARRPCNKSVRQGGPADWRYTVRRETYGNLRSRGSAERRSDGSRASAA